MAEQPPIDIRADHWQIVRDILHRHVPRYEVWAFGSRVKWTAKPHSDLDLAIIADQPLPLAISAALADDFSESDLPWRVDVVDWATTSESFRQIIERDKVVVQKAEPIGLQGRGMGSEWSLVEIGKVALLFDGPHATPKKVESGPVFLGISSLKRGQLDLSSTEHLSEEDFVKWTKRVVPQANDIVFSYETRIGEVASIPEGLRCCLGRRMALLRPDKTRLLPKYLLYYFLSDEFQSLLRMRTIHGSTVDRLPLTDFPSYPVRIPPIEVQDSISKILQTLDDRITLLRETNATLESIAQALFKSWFVDFDPVRAKMEGRVPEGMDEATAALFPDSFEETELGVVPRGWLPVRLDSFIELAYGKALKAENRRPGTVPVYGSGGITGWHDEALVTKPSIIVGRKGTVGSLYWERRPFFPIDTAFYVKSKRPLVYCYQLLQTLGLDNMNTDAAVPGLNRENVYRLLVPNAPDSVVNAFNDVVAALRTVADENGDKAQTLATLRDTLLPRLISGQLRLPQAQDQLDTADGFAHSLINDPEPAHAD